MSRFLLTVLLVSGIHAASPVASMAQNSPCGAFSCEYNRYLEQHERNLDMMFLEDNIRRQQEEQRRRLDEMQRRMDEMQRNQSSVPASPYGPPLWPR